MAGSHLPFAFVRGAFLLLPLVVIAGCSNDPNPAAWTREKTFFQVTPVEPVSFDPTISYDEPDGKILYPIYPTYLRFNFFKQMPWELELGIGLKDPVREPVSGVKVTPQGKVPYQGERWTFELRHDLRFQDDPCFGPDGKGRNVTAKDIEYAFKRMADPRLQFPLAGNLQDKLIGWDSYSGGFAKTGDPARDPNYDRPFEGVKLDPSNPYKFSVTFTERYPQFRFIMAMTFTTPIPREAVERYGKQFGIDHPVGCGPFRMAAYIPHQRIVLERNLNCNFWKFSTTAEADLPPEAKAFEGHPIPLTDRIVTNIILEQVTAYNMFGEGYVDSWSVDQRNSAFVLHSVKPGAELSQRGVKMLTGAYPSTSFLAFNMKDPVFGGYTDQRRKLRQAVSLCIDGDAYINLLKQGLAKPLEFAIPSGIGGYDPNFKNPYRVYDPTLTKAKQLLAEAGYPGGIDPKTHERLTLTLDEINESPADRDRERLMAKCIESLGLKAVIGAENYPTFVDKVKHSKFQAYDWGWIADYPDAENFLMLLCGADAPDPNNSNYSNPEFDKLFAQVRTMDDGPEREALIKRMRTLAVEDCPWVYLSEDQLPVAFQTWNTVKWSNPIMNDVNVYRGVDVDERLRLQRKWNAPELGPLFFLVGAGLVLVLPAVSTVRRRYNRGVRRPAPKGDKRP